MKRGITLSIVLVVSMAAISADKLQVASDLIHQTSSGFNRVEFGTRILLSGECSGRSDYPHISTHIPRTVNVIVETVCPGQKVEVRTTISRHRWLIFRDSVSKSKTGLNKVRLSVSMACKWKVGNPLIEYVVESVHSDSTGASGITRARASLKC